MRIVFPCGVSHFAVKVIMAKSQGKSDNRSAESGVAGAVASVVYGVLNRTLQPKFVEDNSPAGEGVRSMVEEGEVGSMREKKRDF
ncbi:hypothetical protein L484_027134 [Morus notabilis]|uniref:Uncharacterized protein n=1 Tax=Morus notabilis TaxID=981085 RepID=W9S136_9ROSA|nr:hypothetical protein L484_027134 [Morus notabilis]